MSKTANYGLYTCDDNTTKFLDWRLKMNGPDDSNMVKIDEILAQKADSSRIINTMLSASGWSGDNAPFTQTLPIEGLTTIQNVAIDVAQNITDIQLQAACDAKITASEQTDGGLTILAKGTKPSCDIPVTVIIIG